MAAGDGLITRGLVDDEGGDALITHGLVESDGEVVPVFVYVGRTAAAFELDRVGLPSLLLDRGEAATFQLERGEAPTFVLDLPGDPS